MNPKGLLSDPLFEFDESPPPPPELEEPPLELDEPLDVLFDELFPLVLPVFVDPVLVLPVFVVPVFVVPVFGIIYALEAMFDALLIS